jgi:ribonuclease D
VEFLLPAENELKARLDKLGRLSWAEEDSALLLDAGLYEIDPQKAIARLKGARNFRGRKRAAAARLSVWREEEALRRDRPRQWILRDNILLDIAYQLPADEQALAAIEGMPGKLVQRCAADIINAVRQSADDANDYAPPRPPDEEQKQLLKTMQAVVASCAEDLKLAAETIASKKELSGVIMDGSRESRVFSGWRNELIGQELAAML